MRRNSDASQNYFSRPGLGSRWCLELTDVVADPGHVVERNKTPETALNKRAYDGPGYPVGIKMGIFLSRGRNATSPMDFYVRMASKIRIYSPDLKPVTARYDSQCTFNTPDMKIFSKHKKITTLSQDHHRIRFYKNPTGFNKL